MHQKILEIAHGQDFTSTTVHVQIPASRPYSCKGSSSLGDVKYPTLFMMSLQFLTRGHPGPGVGVDHRRIQPTTDLDPMVVIDAVFPHNVFRAETNTVSLQPLP